MIFKGFEEIVVEVASAVGSRSAIWLEGTVEQAVAADLVAAEASA